MLGVRALATAAAGLSLGLLAGRLLADGSSGDLLASLTLDRPGEAVVTLEVDDPGGRLGVSAATLSVDGIDQHELLIFGGSEERRYQALVGPLSAGSHRIALRPSPRWPPDSAVRWRALAARPVAAQEADLARFAPRLLLRPDTVGRFDDLPLLMYVERENGPAQQRLRYSVIFSNEDGGTPTRALLARWGRATDIELAYEIVLEEGRVVEERFQGPDHEMLPFRGAHQGSHPVLAVATLNNLFRDQAGSDGSAQTTVGLLPEPADLSRSTRESVMDGHAWTYALMSAELEREGKLDPASGQPPDQVIADPRRYLYLEARLQLTGAIVVGRLSFADGVSHTSAGGDARLALARSGWVRTAVPLGDRTPRDLATVGWECLLAGPGPSAMAPAPTAAGAGCDVEATRAFLLDSDYTVADNMIVPSRFHLAPGEGRSIPLRTNRTRP